MSDCCISFPGHVSKDTVSHIVIDYMKYILYYRGQFPLPLDQLKQSLEKRNDESLYGSKSSTIDGHQIYCDVSDRKTPIRRSSVSSNRTKQNFFDTISKFDEFFNKLSRILQTTNVMEIVLNLGPNMLNPKELYRITMPIRCSSPECTTDYTSLQRCKLQFFREIMHSNLWADLTSDSLLPISVLLLLENGVTLGEHMERKSFYTLPGNCKQRTVHFIDRCSHLDNTSLELEHFENITLSNTSSASNNAKAFGLWVKLKPDLKGFKSYSEFNHSQSCSSLI